MTSQSGQNNPPQNRITAEITATIHEAVVEAARIGIGRAIMIIHHYGVLYPAAKADCDRLEAMLRAESAEQARMGGL